MNLRLDPRQGRDFAEALARERGASSIPPNAASPLATKPLVAPPLRPDDIDLGVADDTGAPVGIDPARLMEGRLLIQGTSGAGKSWTLRRLLEQTAGTTQHIVLDPEGEFSSLADELDMLRLDGAKLDAAALATAAARVREHRLSVLLDMSDAERETQMIAAAAFLRPLIEAPRDHWHAAIVAIDEAHLFAPFGGDSAAPSSVRKAAIGAVVDLMSRGRKRGLCGILATQRIARLSKSVTSEATNYLIGLNTLDLDIRRAAETIGWDSRRAFDRLPMLEPGDFVAVGRAFSRSPAVLRVGPVRTPHRGAAPAIAAPAPQTATAAAALVGLDGLLAASASDAERIAAPDVPEGAKAVRALLREPSLGLAARIVAALREIAPAWAQIAEMATAFDATPEAVAAALGLLDRYDALEFHGDGAQRAARLARSFR
jgi:hypothetical protein